MKMLAPAADRGDSRGMTDELSGERGLVAGGSAALQALHRSGLVTLRPRRATVDGARAAPRLPPIQKPDDSARVSIDSRWPSGNR